MPDAENVRKTAMIRVDRVFAVYLKRRADREQVSVCELTRRILRQLQANRRPTP